MVKRIRRLAHAAQKGRPSRLGASYSMGSGNHRGSTNSSQDSDLLRVDPSAKDALLDKAHSKGGLQANRRTTRRQRHYPVGRSARVKIGKGSVDEVGYGSPPQAHQFKPGQSGNPRGRPKGAKNEATILRELLNRKIQIREGGRTRKITVLEAIL